MAINFNEMMNTPQSAVERPPLIPVGVYLARVHKIPTFDTVGKDDKWDVVDFSMQIIAPHEAVDEDELKAFGGLGKKAREQIGQALASVGLNGFENRNIGTLSGGQMQRMLFARVLLQDARVIVLDEPFNAIDTKTSADLIALVRHWHAEKRTVLAALHDMDMVRAHFPETLLLARGSVAWGPTQQVLTSDNLLEARRMCEAFDDGAGTCVVDPAQSRAA